MLARLLVTLLALVALAAGCGGDDENGSGDASQLPLQGEIRLEAGEYTTPTFRPQVTFTVGSGWETESTQLRDYLGIARRDFKVISMERVERVFDPKRPVFGNFDDAPADMIKWLREHPRMRPLGEPTTRKVGDVEGQSIDMEIRSVITKRRPAICPDPCLPVFVPSDGAAVNYAKGDRVRFTVVKLGTQTITVAVAAEGPEFRKFLPLAEKVLASVKFAE